MRPASIPLRPRFASARAALAIALLATLLLVPSASSQEDDSGPFGDVIDVRVVNVEAVVTDRDGNRVFGLGPEDFRLTVDGQPVPIDYFTEVQGGQAVAGQFRDGDSGEIASLPALEDGATVGNSYLVFIDDFFSIKTKRDLVLENLIRDLPNLRPEDRMAIVAFDGGNLEMLTTWTSSLETLERVFDDAKQRRASGIFRRAENVNGFGGFATANSFTNNRTRRDQLEMMVGAVTSTLRSFAQPPGRKVMLLLSGAWPSGNFVDAGNSPLSASETDLTLSRMVIETANLLGYTLYPVDMAGLQTARARDQEIFFDPTPVFTGGFAGNASIDRQRRANPIADLTPDVDRHSTLRVLARQTGGKAMLFGDRLKALPKVVADTTSYYWLGFTPERNRDDVRHRIRVEVLRPGLKVRARKTFLDLSRSAEVSMLTQSALLFGDPRALSDLMVEVGQPSPKGLHRMVVPVRVSIPLDRVTVLPTADGYIAELEVRLMAKDVRGGSTGVMTVPLELRDDQPAARGGSYLYTTDLKMRRQPHDLVVSVHDKASGAVLTSLVGVSP